MKIGMQAYGSRGDINPCIALGQGLARYGHQVTLYYTNYTGGDFSSYEEENLKVLSTRELDPESVAYAKIVAKKIYGFDIEDLTDYMVKDVFDVFEKEIILAGELLCRESDILINNANLYHTTCLAEKYQIPRINVMLECQFSPSNRVSQYRDEHINAYFFDRINQYRQSIGLQEIQNVRTDVFNSKELNLLAYSRVFATDEDTWGKQYSLCGYFNLHNRNALELPESVETFLQQGELPIFFSMGSLAFFEGKQFDILSIFLQAIELSGCRAIIEADWNNVQCDIPSGNPNIFLISSILHEKILPRCMGVVHHGGAGTSHAALLNECPSIVVAYAWDQFYWGRELDRLGVSAGMIKRKYIDPIQLAGAIRKLMRDSDYKQTAISTKRNMKREKGIDKAIKTINERYLANKIANSTEEIR